MAENENQHIKCHSTQKSSSQVTATVCEPPKSLSPPNSPTNKEKTNVNSARSRQLWNVAIEGVLEHEKFAPPSTSIASSTVGNAPLGWYDLTKR